MFVLPPHRSTIIIVGPVNTRASDNSNGGSTDPPNPTIDDSIPERFPCEFEGCDKAYRSRGGLKLHMRTHALEIPVAPEEFPCEIMGCGLRFPTRIGLGQHIRHRHPENMDERVNFRRVKERWTVEESRMFARREAEFLVRWERDGRAGFINAVLQAEFPHRILEAIKGRRRCTGHKRMVEDMSEEKGYGGDRRHSPWKMMYE
ncbi:zinc finger protein 143-like [Leptopilina heterotoma]|uniref:zinc finger protein 143-like n=1 Tax=Leptopilina heterotoma TaxID=63436 RepID=UPI001CAA08E3|nr:zinc finger protein 143-like [Leptopilina heterotoma]